nr:hypothetical protein [Tanacetum cinerariifolium]
MTGNLKLLINFVEKFLGTVKFRIDHIAPILGYGDLVQGAVKIKRVYYVEGLNHNLFSVGQFCDADLEVAFRKSTYFIRDLKGNDLLTGSSLFSCELGKAKRKSFHTKLTPSSKRRLHILHMDLCGPMRVASINGKRYVLVIVDDYSRYAWTHFLRSKNETPEVLIDFLRLKGFNTKRPLLEQLNRTALSKDETVLLLRLLEQCSAAKVPLFFWAEAIATACFTQNHGENLEKMKEKGDECIFVGYSTQSRAYRVFNKRTRVIMESIHVNFDEFPQMASAHNSSDPAPSCQTMASVQISSDLAPECQTMALEHDSLSPERKCQENVSHRDKIVKINYGGSLSNQILASPSNEKGNSNNLTVVLGTSGCLNVDVTLLKKWRWLCGSCLPVNWFD